MTAHDSLCVCTRVCACARARVQLSLLRALAAPHVFDVLFFSPLPGPGATLEACVTQTQHTRAHTRNPARTRDTLKLAYPTSSRCVRCHPSKPAASCKAFRLVSVSQLDVWKCVSVSICTRRLLGTYRICFGLMRTGEMMHAKLLEDVPPLFLCLHL